MEPKMKKEIDLSAFSPSVLKVILPDKRELFIKSPEVGMAIRMEQIEKELTQNVSAKSVYELTSDLCREILNYNTSGVVVSDEEMDNISFELRQKIVRGYIQFIDDIYSSPNF